MHRSIDWLGAQETLRAMAESFLIYLHVIYT
jgi:hypothetical protein